MQYSVITNHQHALSTYGTQYRQMTVWHIWHSTYGVKQSGIGLVTSRAVNPFATVAPLEPSAATKIPVPNNLQVLVSRMSIRWHVPNSAPIHQNAANRSMHNNKTRFSRTIKPQGTAQLEPSLAQLSSSLRRPVATSHRQRYMTSDRGGHL